MWVGVCLGAVAAILAANAGGPAERGGQAAQRGPEFVLLRPERSDEPLFNPGMGIYLMVGRNTRLPEGSWLFKFCRIAYHRCDWADLEPEPGVYKFDEYFGPMLDYWVRQLGWRFAFRVMCENMHSRKKYVTPKWVFDAGVPGFVHRGLYVKEQVDPVFWHPKYLELQCRFIRALSEWVERQEGIEFVDIGSIGEWGEMHLGLHIPGRWTREQLREAGFTEYRYIMAYRRIIDAFADAMPHTRVFLNVGGYMQINDYAAARGINFRQDGLGLHGASYLVDQKLYPEYAFRGVQCNLELLTGYSGMKARGWDPRAVVRRGLQSPISYMNINFGAPNMLTNPPAEVREAVEEAARRIGYRFRLVSVRIPRRVRVSEEVAGRLPVMQEWVNEGIAPCYEHLALEWRLVDGAGRAVASEAYFPAVPTTKWLPGKAVKTGCVLEIPAGTAPGRYGLQVRLFMPERPEVRYYLAMKGGDGRGWYTVGQVEVVRGRLGPREAVRLDFERPEQLRRVSTAKGIKASIAPGQGRGGSAALWVRGTCEKTWNYAVLARLPVLPGARYRLEAWMLVRSCEGAPRKNRGPHLKVGVDDAEGEWVENFNTQPYDMGRRGQWQKLTVEFDCPVEGARGYICIERGEYEPRMSVDLLIDDVVLTLLGGI